MTCKLMLSSPTASTSAESRYVKPKDASKTDLDNHILKKY